MNEAVRTSPLAPVPPTCGGLTHHHAHLVRTDGVLYTARNNPFPIFNGTTRSVVTSYDNWRAPVKGGQFDPGVDLFLNRSVFPSQPSDQFGNVTRYNPKVRSFPNVNENISLAKSFRIRESKRVDFRWEAFNLFNRTVFPTPSTNLNSTSFGR